MASDLDTWISKMYSPEYLILTNFKRRFFIYKG